MLIILKELNISMVNSRYLNWLQDIELMKYTEQVNKNHTIKNVKNYVLECKKSKKDFLLGIFVKEKKKTLMLET